MRIALLSIALIGFLLGSCGREPTVAQNPVARALPLGLVR